MKSAMVNFSTIATSYDDATGDYDGNGDYDCDFVHDDDCGNDDYATHHHFQQITWFGAMKEKRSASLPRPGLNSFKCVIITVLIKIFHCPLLSSPILNAQNPP